MQEILQFAASSIAAPRVPKSIAFGGRLILVPLLLLTLAALAMEAGAWRKYVTITGPFAAETSSPQRSLILSVPDQGPLAWWQQPLNNDSLEKPYESRLHLSINGREMWPAHSRLESIRKGETEGFSHWESGVVFSLPQGSQNSSAAVATLRYNIKPRPWVTVVLLIASLALGWLCFHVPVKKFAQRHWQPASAVRRSVERLAAVLLPLPYLILLGLCCLGLFGVVVFLGASLYALMNGWALPTTAPIRWFPLVEWAARNEPYLGQLLVSLAALGALVAWLSFACEQSEQSVIYELKLRKCLRWSGLPIAACAFILSASAMWAGMVRAGDPQWSNIAGFIPYSDAHGHLAYAYYQARDGNWAEFAARRPLAAAFREVLVFASDYSFPVTLALQACLLAFAACVAAYAVMVWRGIWTGLAFFGLAYIYVRVFAPTSLTESLGVFWSLLSIPFFVESFRTGSARPAFVGFAATAIALMIRMGSMFTIPALLLWLVWQFGCGARAKIRVAVLATGILLGVLGTNALLQEAYGTPGAGTGSNFSYTLCGLTIGTTWDGCLAKLSEQGRPLRGDSEAAVARRLYALAWENFRERPSVFFNRIKDGADAFLAQLGNVMFIGYDLSVGEPSWLFRRILTAIALAGLVYIAIRLRAPRELAFWALVWASIVASAAIVYFDDGVRVLAASQPLMALFFAIGMSNPQLPTGRTEENRSLTSYGVFGLLLAAGLFVCVPWLAYSLYDHSRGFALRPAQDEAFVFGGRRMSGLLVVEDGEQLRADTPTIHFTDFVEIARQANVYDVLLRPFTPKLPFGFVFAPRLERGIISPSLFFVPPYVLERRDVKTWHFFLDLGRPKSDLWPLAVRAEPWGQ
jgi:hypothetical protein